MVLGVALAWQIDTLIGLEGALVSRTTVLLCIGALFVVWPLRAHHPFDRVGVANQITMMRGVLVLLLLSFVGMGQTLQMQVAALSIAMISSALDAADGWAARRTRMSSRYGARFDMETDALLILTLSLLAWQFDKAGLWVLASGLMRYAFILAARLLPWMQRPLPPSQRRKVVAVLQVVSLVIAIAPFVSPGVSAPLSACALALLAWSFLIDVAWLRRHASDSMAVS